MNRQREHRGGEGGDAVVVEIKYRAGRGQGEVGGGGGRGRGREGTVTGEREEDSWDGTTSENSKT